MFTSKDLIAGETVLVFKDNPAHKRLYLSNAGLVHFISATNKYKLTGGFYTIEELNEWYTIEQPKSKVVPLDKKVYDFVPVRVRDGNGLSMNWRNAFLVAVVPFTKFPFKTVDESGHCTPYEYCEFLNEQSNERNT